MKQIGSALWKWFENFVRCVMGFVFKILHIKMDDARWEKFMQFVKFCLVGVSNVIVDLTVYWIALTALSLTGWNGFIGNFEGVDVQIATVFGFLAHITNSYYWNNKHVFGDGKKKRFAEHLKSYFKVMAAYSMTGIVLAFGLNLIWINLLHLPKMLAALFNKIIAIPLDFLLDKFWAFKK